MYFYCTKYTEEEGNKHHLSCNYMKQEGNKHHLSCYYMEQEYISQY